MYIFNKILSTGILPERLKFSEVKPLYKKENKTEFSNYRPISLLTSFSKITEKIIYKRLYCHLNYNNIPYILESNPHPNLIRTSFCQFLKRKKS
jgi:hypothetical protein